MGFLFGVRGRLNRGKWWLAGLIYLVLETVIGSLVAGALVSAVLALPKPDPLSIIGVLAGFGGVGIVLLIVSIVIWISAITVSARRLHDRDKSAWWLLLFYVVPIVLSGIGQSLQVQTGSPSSGLAFGLASLAILIWAFVELGCLRGTQGPNRYGADPLGGA
jgi:uncharacterized membrane protein YhaH (DUF805 family)